MLRCGIVDSIAINHRVTQVTDKGNCSELQRKIRNSELLITEKVAC